MKAAVLLTVLLLAPAIAGCTSDRPADGKAAITIPTPPPGDTAVVPPFPLAYTAVARGWTRALRDDLAAAPNASWRAEADRYAASAEEFAEAGRVHSAIADLVHARVVMTFHPFWSEVENVTSDSARRARVASASDAWREEAAREAARYRERLHALEADLSSLTALEAALYSADWFMEGHYSASVFDLFRKEVHTDRFDASLALGLVSVTVGASWIYSYAGDLLGVAEATEGVAPRYEREKWTQLARIARTPAGDFSPPHTKPYDDLIAATNGTGEDVLAVSAYFAVIKANSVDGVNKMFGDASSRGIPATRDLGENVNRSLAASPLSRFEEIGFDGLLARAGLDQAKATLARPDELDIPALARAWIAIEHARQMADYLAPLSPVPRPGA